MLHIDVFIRNMEHYCYDVLQMVRWILVIFSIQEFTNPA
jgi:hypothetical protein